MTTVFRWGLCSLFDDDEYTKRNKQKSAYLSSYKYLWIYSASFLNWMSTKVHLLLLLLRLWCYGRLHSNKITLYCTRYSKRIKKQKKWTRKTFIKKSSSLSSSFHHQKQKYFNRKRLTQRYKQITQYFFHFSFLIKNLN